MSAWRALRAAVALTLLRRPRGSWQGLGARHFWFATVALAAIALALMLGAVGTEVRFNADGLRGLAFVALFALLLAWALSSLLRRPALLWPLAGMIVLVQALIAGLAWLIAWGTGADWWQESWLGFQRLQWLQAAWFALAAVRLLQWLEPQRRRGVRLAAAIGLGVALLLPSLAWLDHVMLVYPDWGDDEGPPEAIADATPALVPERVLGEQPARVDAALATVPAGRPGVIDLYVLAFGGDGSEDVFRNEVLYAERLFAERFGARGTMVLLNHPDSVDVRPLATLANLERALAGLGARMDRDEDLLLVFLTTHGSEGHQLYVSLDPLPLQQIRPDALAAALDASGVRHRVVLVSACYSGGFLPALASETTLVLTAAREDRTSFGCGAESEVTWFGRAYLVEALNAGDSLVEAFDAARERIAEWEREEERDASEPQIALGAAMQVQLERWRAGLEPGPTVAFDPEGLAGQDDPALPAAAPE